jgi:alkaline phosphatase D
MTGDSGDGETGSERDGRADGSGGPSSHDRFVELLSARSLPVARSPTAAADGATFETTGAATAEEVFPQSVASGSPTPTGVVLWTRVAPEAYDPGREVGLEVATDAGFENVVYRGVCDVTHGRLSRRDYTVKLDLDGELRPGREYAYRFVHAGARSPTGRCRTLPAPDASPDSVRFAVVCCQDYLNGYFGAYHHIARDDVDFLVHLGDTVYESSEGAFRGPGSEPYPDRHIELPSGNDRPHSIDDYRHIHRTYHTDRFLAAALEELSLIGTWDDHEFLLDLFWDREHDAPGGDHPKNDDPAFMRRLAADALQAWWEYTPTRVGYDPDGETFGDRFELWSTFEFGDLATVVMTDERLYRDEPHGERVPIRRFMNPEYEPEGQTMLGEEQFRWLVDEVESSGHTWKLWANEVLTVPFKLGAGPLTFYPTNTGWDGFMQERQRLFEALDEADVSNFVTLSGDMHCYLAGYQQTAYDDSLRRLLTGEGADPSTRVGVEFMTPAMTSINFAEAANVDDGWRGRLTEPLLSRGTTWQNPHVEFFDSHHWGYSTVELTPEKCTYTAYAVDKTTNSATAERERLARFSVPEGRVELVDETT